MAVFGKRIGGFLLAATSTLAPAQAQNSPEREPTIWFRREANPAGQSWLGGQPSLPSGVAWPRHGVTNLPLHFLAQIDLAELPATPLRPGGPALPREGLLLFFADIEEEMLWDEQPRGTKYDSTRVLHVEAGSTVSEPPQDIPEISHSFGEARGSYSAGYASYPVATVKPYLIDSFPGQGVYFQNATEKSVDALLIDSIEAATGAPVPRLPGTSNFKLSAAVSEYKSNDGTTRSDIHIVRHQMLGAAHSVQGTADEMREAGYVSLFQLDSDYGVDDKFIFCDVGMVQFWILPADLEAMRFDRAFATTEGG